MKMLSALAIDQTNIVDAAGVDRQTGEAVLTIIDSWDWEDEVLHLRLLKAKLQSYFSYIESGEVFESFAPSRGRTIRIDAIFRYEPPSTAVIVLQQAKDSAARIPVAIVWRVERSG